MITKEKSNRQTFTERDLRILEYIQKNKHNDCREICENFWKGKNNHHHYRRLRLLRKRKLIIFYYHGSNWGFKLTSKGKEYLGHFNRTVCENWGQSKSQSK